MSSTHSPPSHGTPHAPRNTQHATRFTHHVSLLLYTALFLFLFAIYLLTYTPRINSSDGLAMFATAESLVRHGALDIEQIRWLGLQQGTFGLDGLLYSRKGIGVPLAMLPLTWLGLVVPWVGPVGTTLLFNAIVTALTAVLLAAYLQALNFSRRTSAGVALIFGLATLAWPYAKSLFSDPFAGLLLLAAALILLKFHHRQKRSGAKAQEDKGKNLFSSTLIYPFLAGLFLGWNVATRYAEVLFVPVFGLLLLYYLSTIYDLRFTIKNSKFAIQNSPFKIQNSQFTIFSIAAFTIPIMIIGLALLAFNVARYGDPLNTGYLPNETFSAPLWEGVLGQLVSPGRGLLLYCPILILSFFGIVPFFRRFRAEAIVASSIIIIHLLLYGKWFMWHGGYAWGPRFMMPTLPFWAMFLAPVLERVFNLHSSRITHHASRVRKRVMRSAILLLIAASLLPQLLAVTLDFAPFQNALLDTGLPLFARQTFFDPQYSALIGAWRFISIDSLDLAWAWQGQINWGLLGLLTINIIITGFWLVRTEIGDWRLEIGDWIVNDQSPNLLISTLPLLSTLITAIFLLMHVHSLPSPPLQQTVARLNKSIRPNDAVITNDPEIAAAFAELYKGEGRVLGLNVGGFPLADDVTRRLNDTLARHNQIWWLPNWLPPEESAIEQILTAQNIHVFNENFNGRRLVLFAQPPQSAASQPSNANFDGQVRLLQNLYPPHTAAGSTLPLELHWQAAQPLTDDYNVFVHLLDPQGQLIAQSDGQPAQWTRPTSTWSVGETVVDRHGLWIPPDTPAAEYSLRVGLYQPATGQRLSLPNGQDAIQFDLQIE